MLNSKCRLILLILLSAFVVSCNKVLTFLSPWYIHEPRNNCTVCHGTRKQRGFSAPTRLIAGVPKLCYDCHTDYTISTPFVHGPVAVGKCLICHNPHKSKTKHLLEEPEPKLCYQCHDITPYTVSAPFVHGPVAVGQCLICHDPHKSKTEHLLKEPEPGLCYQCHDITLYTVSAPFVHGPVAVGQCLLCHNPHKSKTEHLLKEPEPELCYRCHIAKEIEIIPAHLTKLSYVCTDCHEAHASSIKYLLKVLPNSDLRRTR